MIGDAFFRFEGTAVDVADWNLNDSEGGYDQCSGVVPIPQWRAAGSPTQGARVTAEISGAESIWAGMLAAPPQLLDGQAHFNAVGDRSLADKKTDRLLVQSADLSKWVPSDSEPHLNASDIPVYDHIRKVDLESTHGVLRFGLTRDQNMATGDSSCFVFYAEGQVLGNVRFTMTYNAADEFAKLDIRVQKANGPIGAESNVTTIAVNNANNGSHQNVTIGGAGNDLLTLGLHCNDGTFAPNNNHMKWSLTKVRVNSDVTSADSYNAADVISFIATELGWDTSGIDITTFDVLPFDWDDGSWLDAMLYVAELEDRFVRIGDEAVTYDDWGATNWTVFTTDGADPDLKPLELFNCARVYYETAAGVPRQKTRTTTDLGLTDPIPTLENCFEYAMADRQKDSVVPQAVADKLVRRYSRQRYSGTIEVVRAYDDTGRLNPRAIRYGDTVTIADWGPGESKTLRVMEVSQTPQGVTLGVEQPVNIAALVEHISRRKRRRGLKAHVGL